LGGAVAAVEELGWSNVTVASVTSRARVSRRTFYDLFGDREDCLLEVLKDTSARIVSELDGVSLSGLSWRERVRRGLQVVLCFFDREPELARFCVVQSARGNRRVQEWRGEILEILIAFVDEGRLEGERAAQASGVTAEGVVGGVLAIVQKRVIDEEPVSVLLGVLMALVVLPYLGAKVARAAAPVAFSSQSGWAGRAYSTSADPLKDVPMRLTYRTALVLEAAAQHPGASNRVIGERAGVHDQGQVSKLLARLERLGLLINAAGRDAHTKGAPNAWSLTELGERVTRHLALGTDLQGQTE
jgi:AcrR family transcriptional regulator